jgi:hypothetical protein
MRIAVSAALAVFALASSARAEAPVAPPGAVAPAPAAAAAPVVVPPAPTAAEIQKVTNYFLNGKDGGPILMDLVFCADVKKNADGKLACVDPLGDTVKTGDTLAAFVKLFAPKGGKYEDIKLRFLLNGEVRSTSDFTVTEAWTGYGNYKKTTASKPGTWEIEVLRGDVVLGKKSIVAQ